MSITHIDCRFVEDHIADFLGGELPDPTAQAIEAHMASCSACAARWSELAPLRDKVASVAGQSHAADLATRSMQPPMRSTPRSSLFGRLAIAAAILLAFLAGYLVGAPSPHASVPTPGTPVALNPTGRSEPQLPKVARDYLNATRQRPQANSFGWALISAARQ